MTEKTLHGRRIVLTRARAQVGGLAQRIAELGGEAIEFPTIEIQALEDYSAFDAALADIHAYDWLMFTSVNAIEPFFTRLKQVGRSVTDLKHLHIAAIGSETAKRLAAAGISVDMLPARYQAEGILDSLTAEAMGGKRVLLPRAAKARDVLPETLRRWGAHVDVIEAYRTVAPAVDIATLQRLLQRGEVDMITFTSSSTVSNFTQLFGGAPLTAILGATAVACIGPITAKTVEELGGQVAIIARQFTTEGLLDAIVVYFNQRAIIGEDAPAVRN